MEKGSLANPVVPLEVFTEESAKRIADALKPFKGEVAIPRTEVYDREALEAFLTIDDESAARGFYENHVRLFGEVYSWEDLPSGLRESGIPLASLMVDEGVKQASYMLQMVSQLYAKRDHVCEENGTTLLAKANANRFEAWYKDSTLRIRLGYSFYWHYLKYLVEHSAETTAEGFGSKATRWSIEDDNAPFSVGLTYRFDPGANGHTLLDIADVITSLHFADVRTGVRGGDEYRFASSGLGALWWLRFDQLREGRVFQCAACGKVCVAVSRRGVTRRFCSDACKQWRSQHKDKDENGDYIEWLPPRR